MTVVGSMHVPGLRYASDVIIRMGVETNLVIRDIAGTRVSETPTCPMLYGACVKCVNGGVVEGYDYLWQRITETCIIPFQTTGKAFYYVTTAPPSATWTNHYGLPYAYESGGAEGLLFMPPAPHKDHRGTVTLLSPVPDGTEVRLGYRPVADDLHGQPY